MRSFHLLSPRLVETSIGAGGLARISGQWSVVSGQCKRLITDTWLLITGSNSCGTAPDLFTLSRGANAPASPGQRYCHTFPSGGLGTAIEVQLIKILRISFTVLGLCPQIQLYSLGPPFV